MRGRHRTFDYEEAKRLRATGDFTRKQLADRFGVSVYAIDYATKPQLRDYARGKQLGYRVPCEDCGAPMHGRYRPSAVCKPCANIRAATSVRPDALRCSTCREWKPDDSFPHNSSEAARRGRHTLCRACTTEQKRAYRRRNPNYERDYVRARRVAAKGAA